MIKVPEGLKYDLKVSDSQISLPLIQDEERKVLSQLAASPLFEGMYPEEVRALRELLIKTIRAEGFIRNQDTVLQSWRTKMMKWLHTIRRVD